MRTDSSLAFIPLGGNLTFTASSTSTPSTNVIDLLGQGVGTAPVNTFGTTQAVFGADLGVGHFRPEIAMASGTSAFSGTSLNVQLQGAVDPGAGSSYTPTTWTTFAESGVITLATTAIAANTVFFRFPWLPAWPNTQAGLPRFLRLNFVPVSFTGVIPYALVTFARDDMQQRFAQRNYTVA